MLSDTLWPLNREFNERVTAELKAKVHGQFGDHEFDKKVAAVCKLAEACWAKVKASAGEQPEVQLVTVHVQPSTRKKTISIGLRFNPPRFSHN